MEDEQIILLLEHRDERALAALRDKYGKSCRNIAYRFVGDLLDADEIVSDTLLQAWNAIPPAHPENLFAFLSTITRRNAVNRYHKDHAKKRGGDSVSDAALDELADCIPSGQDVESRVEQRALIAALNRYLAALSPEMRAIVVQRYVHLHSVREIADAYQITESKVKITLMRARKRLRRALEKEEWI